MGGNRVPRQRPGLVLGMGLATVLAFGSAMTMAVADTVYLKNGASIDGVVVGQQDGLVIVEIGNIGRMCIAERDVKHIDRNDLAGPVSDRSTRPVPVPLPDQPENPTPPQTPEGAGATSEKPTAGAEVKPATVELTPEQEKVIQELIFELTRHDTRKRTRAERQLLDLGPEVVPAVLPLTTHPMALTRTAAFRVLKKHGDLVVIDASLAGLEDENQWVRKLAWETLCRVSGRGFPFPWDETASPARRQSATVRWQQWWAQKQEQLEEEARKREAGQAKQGA